MSERRSGNFFFAGRKPGAGLVSRSVLLRHSDEEPWVEIDRTDAFVHFDAQTGTITVALADVRWLSAVEFARNVCEHSTGDHEFAMTGPARSFADAEAMAQRLVRALGA